MTIFSSHCYPVIINNLLLTFNNTNIRIIIFILIHYLFYRLVVVTLVCNDYLSRKRSGIIIVHTRGTKACRVANGGSSFIDACPLTSGKPSGIRVKPAFAHRKTCTRVALEIVGFTFALAPTLGYMLFFHTVTWLVLRLYRYLTKL